MQNTINCVVVCSLDVFRLFYLEYLMFDILNFRCSTIILKQVLPTSLAYKQLLHPYYSLRS